MILQKNEVTGLNEGKSKDIILKETTSGAFQRLIHTGVISSITMFCCENATVT